MKWLLLLLLLVDKLGVSINLRVEGGGHVLQCPVAGDATGDVALLLWCVIRLVSCDCCSTVSDDFI